MKLTLELFFKETQLSEANLWELNPINQNSINVSDKLDNEKWLEVARRINKKVIGFSIHSIFFLEKNPISVFVKLDNELVSSQQVFNTIWNLARPRFLFIEKMGEIEVYDLGQKPDKQQPLSILKKIKDCLKYHRDIQESDNLFLTSKLSSHKNTADISLISDLKELRKIFIGKKTSTHLLKNQILTSEQAHTLIGQTIFVRYLEDRNILDKSYFEKVANQNPEWLNILAQNIDKSQLLNPEIGDKFFVKMLQNKDFAIALFQTLSEDLNGDIFLKNENYDFLKQEHLDILSKFLLADVHSQRKLWLWAYQFDIIPLELISSIYEEFYHKDVEKEGDKNGTHYTPSSLVDFMLSQTLTIERLQNNPRILDPACGSGIFLVESFRRIVRYKRLYENFKPNFDNLTEIIRNQILGIELNEKAARITAFSLYIALLDFLDPPYIQNYIQKGKKLPFFLYQQQTSDNHLNIILPQNTFWVENLFLDDKGTEKFQPNSVDIIVGNPPWGSAEKGGEEDKKAMEWCKQRNFPISDNERSKMFIWRSYALLKEGGVAALLVSSGVLFNSSEGNNDFKRQWTGKTTLLQIFNFVHTRHVFFSAAISPFLGVIFQKKTPARSHFIQYWSFLYTRHIAKAQAIVLDKTCFKCISQSLAHIPDIWKIHYFGNTRDYAVISGMRLYPQLKEIVLNYDDLPKQGYKENDKAVTLKHYEWLPKKTLNTKSLNNCYAKISEKQFVTTPDLVAYPSSEELFNGLRILFKRGISKKGEIIVRLHDEKFAFRNSINCFKLQTENGNEYKLILGILWSKLSLYYYFLTTTNFGSWHDEIQPSEMMSLPIMELDEDNRIYQEQIISIVNQLREGKYVENNFLTGKSYSKTIAELERELDEAVFEFYYFSDADKDLIWDRCKYEIDYYYNKTKSIALKPLQNLKKHDFGCMENISATTDINNYLQAFYLAFSPYIKQKKQLYFEYIRSFNINWHTEQMSDLICVLFSFDNKPFMGYKQNEWQQVIHDIQHNLKMNLTDEIYVENFLRILSQDYIIIIRRNEKRLWTRTAAREDAEAIFAQHIHLSKATIV